MGTSLRYILMLAICLSASAFAQSKTILGLRLDPGYLYDDFPYSTSTEMARAVVSKAAANGVNTLYLYAYNSVYGSYYPTSYSMTTVENGLGVENIFSKITLEAKARGLRVVAVIPINNFKSVWAAKSDWRVKKKSGADYRPDADTYLLSSWHPDFRSWYVGFVQDLIQRNPSIDTVEAVEGMIDYNWNWSVDFNAAANSAYYAAYPRGRLGDKNWKTFRALGLTTLHGLMATKAHEFGKSSAVVQTWTTDSAGTLYSSASIRDGAGFDFDGLMNLTGTSKIDYVMGEFMWQQWASEYGNGVFTPYWTTSAASQFYSKTAGRTTPIVHVEVSDFWGSATYVEPTPQEFYQSVKFAVQSGMGVDVYDYHQIEVRGVWPQLKAAFTGN